MGRPLKHYTVNDGSKKPSHMEGSVSLAIRDAILEILESSADTVTSAAIVDRTNARRSVVNDYIWKMVKVGWLIEVDAPPFIPPAEVEPTPALADLL